MEAAEAGDAATSTRQDVGERSLATHIVRFWSLYVPIRVLENPDTAFLDIPVALRTLCLILSIGAYQWHGTLTVIVLDLLTTKLCDMLYTLIVDPSSSLSISAIETMARTQGAQLASMTPAEAHRLCAQQAASAFDQACLLSFNASVLILNLPIVTKVGDFIPLSFSFLEPPGHRIDTSSGMYKLVAVSYPVIMFVLRLFTAQMLDRLVQHKAASSQQQQG